MHFNIRWVVAFICCFVFSYFMFLVQKAIFWPEEDEMDSVVHEDHSACPNCRKMIPFTPTEVEMECPFCYCELTIIPMTELSGESHGYSLVRND